MIFFEQMFPDIRNKGFNIQSGTSSTFGNTPNFTGGATFSAGTFNFTGATVTGLTSGVEGIVAKSTAAFYVGQTAANPALNVNTNTSTSATGVSIISAAAGAGVEIQTITSGTNENISIDAAGTGTLSLNATATNSGAVTIGNSTSKAGATVNGPLTTTGGQVALNGLTGNNVNWGVGGPPASLTSYNDTTATVAGTIYWTQLWLDTNLTLTGVGVIIGTTGTTDNWSGLLYNSAGTLVASTTLSTVTVGTASTSQLLPFSSTYNATGPGWYFIGLQSNGTHATFMSYNVNVAPYITGSQTGVYGTYASITPGTSWNTNKGPVSFVY